jgi:hypothetical protein
MTDHQYAAQHLGLKAVERLRWIDGGGLSQRPESAIVPKLAGRGGRVRHCRISRSTKGRERMMHKNRRYSVADVATAEELAEKLTNHTWCGCNGFRWNGLLFLNDSTGPDGAQEYAVMRRIDGTASDSPFPCIQTHEYEQVESVTFGWMTYAEALDWLQRGELCERLTTWRGLVQTPDEHGRCRHCA